MSSRGRGRGMPARGRGAARAKPKPKPSGPSKAQMLAIVQERQRQAEEEKRLQEEAEREEEEARKKEEELKRKAEADKQRKKEAKKARIKDLKDKGLYKSQRQLEKEKVIAARREALLAARQEAEQLLQKKAEEAAAQREREAHEAALEAEQEAAKAQALSATEESELDDWEAMASSTEGESEVEEAESHDEEEAHDSNELTLPSDFEPLTDKQYKRLQKAKGTKGREELIKYENLLELYNQKMAIEKNKRSPICCILGHVDCGKTLILDKIRQTNVQEGEAGGITQQIGATFFPMERVADKCLEVPGFKELQSDLPGLLIIDTPGHESFTNLRSRGSSLCDIAILVVDLMHGLEPQTRESIGLLKQRKTPFVIALNKIDRLYTWKTHPNAPIQQTLAQQNQQVLTEFENRWTEIRALIAGEGINSALYYDNEDDRRFVNVVPTSAVTGEGIPDLLYTIVRLTQLRMSTKLTLLADLQCTVLEVKSVEGLGVTIDVILSNGVLRVGDTIVLCGMNGPIVTTIRALLTPQPMKELRVKTPYVKNEEVRAAMGLKIYATELEGTIAGSHVLVAGPEDDIEELEEEAMKDLTQLLDSVKTVDKGVYVQASTLGSLEALLSFLKTEKIPVSCIGIGPLHKKDVMRASIMIERGLPQYGVILAFDVKVTPEAHKMAEDTGVKVITADIIYHLTDAFTRYTEEVRRADREKAEHAVVFPTKLSIVKDCVFNNKDPIIVGVKVEVGTLRIGTPIFVPNRSNLTLGRVTSIENNHKSINVASTGQEVAVRIQNFPGQPSRCVGRHFVESDYLYSRLTRSSIDALKASFREELTPDVVKLVQEVKKHLDI
ncbi:hypothetical protein P9112_012598 [Eukaryota sp. TZLM1-RC]